MDQTLFVFSLFAHWFPPFALLSMSSIISRENAVLDFTLEGKLAFALAIAIWMSVESSGIFLFFLSVAIGAAMSFLIDISRPRASKDVPASDVTISGAAWTILAFTALALVISAKSGTPTPVPGVGIIRSNSAQFHPIIIRIVAVLSVGILTALLSAHVLGMRWRHFSAQKQFPTLIGLPESNLWIQSRAASGIFVSLAAGCLALLPSYAGLPLVTGQMGFLALGISVAGRFRPISTLVLGAILIASWSVFTALTLNDAHEDLSIPGNHAWFVAAVLLIILITQFLERKIRFRSRKVSEN